EHDDGQAHQQRSARSIGPQDIEASEAPGAVVRGRVHRNHASDARHARRGEAAQVPGRMTRNMTMDKHINSDRLEASAPRTSKRARLQALLFAAGSIATTLLTLGMLADSKLPRYLGE